MGLALLPNEPICPLLPVVGGVAGGVATAAEGVGVVAAGVDGGVDGGVVAGVEAFVEGRIPAEEIGIAEANLLVRYCSILIRNASRSCEPTGRDCICLSIS